jgi:hypothetical protein
MSQPDDAAFFTADFTALPAEQLLKKWRQQVLNSERDRAAYIQARAYLVDPAAFSYLCYRYIMNGCCCRLARQRECS